MKRGSNQTTALGAKPACARLFVLDALDADAHVALERPRAHYLRDVLRLRIGARVRLFNGRDGEWEATISDLAKSRARIAVDTRTRRQTPEPGPTLLFAPVKRAAVDLIVEKATELGATALQPIVTGHTGVSRVNLDRLRAIAIEAAEQCERLTVPDVREPARLATWLGRKPAEAPLLVCAERRDRGATLAEAVARLPSGAELAILIGPEGGFREDEIATLSAAPGARLATLGPRVLRAETAAIAALAIAGAARR